MKKIAPIGDKNLLQQALTHRSYINEHPETKGDNERLEFLGDAILGFVVGELLYKRYLDLNEAQLTRLRSLLVDEKQLAKFASEIGLSQKIYLGKGAEKDKGRENPSILSDAFEAMVGAYFLDAGMEAVQKYIQPLIISVADTIVFPKSDENSQNLIDSKNRFQQWALANIGENPQYHIIDESGLDHLKEFTAEVSVKGKVYGVGKDRRKQEAEKRAAESALKKLGL